jgi:hypothetical protein
MYYYIALWRFLYAQAWRAVIMRRTTGRVAIAAIRHLQELRKYSL